MNQLYNPSLGVQGNLEYALEENKVRYGEILAEQSNRINDVLTQRLILEQALTDADISNIVAEQSITDLDLRVLELEAKVN